jgi:hypothetical protein
MKTTLLSACAGVLLILPGCFVDFDNGPADIQTLRESRPIGDAKDLSVRLKYGVGRLEIDKATDDNLFSLDVQYDQNRTTPRFNFEEGEHATMRLEMDTRGMGGSRRRDNDLVLRLSDKIPMDFEVSTGVSESHLDMSGLQVSRMKLEGGVGKTEVLFDKPSSVPMESFEMESGVGELIIRGLGNARPKQVKLEGGVGHTELDFTGELGTTTTDCSIEVGVGQVRLVLPRDADIEIQGEGSFLSNINAPSFDRDGKTYTHRGDGGAKIRIRVESGVGGVSVELI